MPNTVPRDRLPRQLRRIKSRDGFIGLWRRMAQTIYSPRIMEGLPPHAEKVAKRFWMVDPGDVVTAANDGDVALFIAFLLRVDQIDAAMRKAGRSYAERSPLIRCRYIIDGFMQAAIERLREKGGEWPLSAPDSPEAPSD